MEVFIRNELSVSSDLTLEQATQHSAKLLSWLLDCQEQMQLIHQHNQLELNYTDIECMFKATLYLNECHARYGHELVEAVLEQFNNAQASIRRFYESCEGEESKGGEQCIKDLCGLIINGTRNGHTMVPLLFKMHKAYAEVQPAWGIIKYLNWSKIVEDNKANDTLDVARTAELNIDGLQMQSLVRRIFRLANVDDMKIALKRAMNCINFELWLQLFREPKDSILYTRCYVLRQMICDMLQEGITSSSSSSFVHHIYNFVTTGNSSSCNISRLLRSLLHVRFANALGSYFVAYWTQQLPHLQLDDLQFSEEAPIVDLPLDEILYLTHLLLTPKSPCRSQFYAELKTLPLFNRMLEILNKVAYVYS